MNIIKFLRTERFIMPLEINYVGLAKLVVKLRSRETLISLTKDVLSC